jgi:hypothetical protein
MQFVIVILFLYTIKNDACILCLDPLLYAYNGI